MDADDIMEPDRLSIQYEFMERHPWVDVLSGAIQPIDALGNISGSAISTEDKEITLADMLDGCCIAHPSVMIRGERVAPFKDNLYNPDFSYAEDYELWVRLLSEGLHFYNISSVLLRYRLHPNQISIRCKDIQSSKTSIIRREAMRNLELKVRKTCDNRNNIKKSNNKLTIVIPFLNEYNEVRNTVQSIRHTAGMSVDIIVVNDHSDSDYDYQSDVHEFDVVYIENECRIGAALSKEKGVQMCQTPYFLILDAHMRFYDHNWATYIISELDKNSRRLLCSKSIPLQKEEEDIVSRQKEGNEPYGAYLYYGAESYVPSVRWNNVGARLTSLSDQQIPCVLGAGYSSSKEYWNYLHGLQGLMHYGCEEAYISIKAWREGGGCYLLPDLYIGHIYREKFPYKVFPLQYAYNYLFIAEALFPTSEKCYAKAVAWKVDRNRYHRIIELLQMNASRVQDLKDCYHSWRGLDYEQIKHLNNECARENARHLQISSDEVSQILQMVLQQEERPGLFNGTMASLLFLLIYVSKHSVTDVIEQKIISIWESLTADLKQADTLPLFFKNGLSGMGWGLIYASSHHLLDDDIQDELMIIDQQISLIAPRRVSDKSFLSGLGGIYCYVVARLGYNQERGFRNGFDTNFINELHECTSEWIYHNIDWRTVNFMLQFAEYGNSDWKILPPEFQEIVETPHYVPKSRSEWELSLTGAIGSAINQLLSI
jgi:glycosyltransferase involved in cell wall biosynthesis